MSGFEDNPFGEPVYQDPFTDPSIQQVAKSAVQNQQNLDDYNPFDNNTTTQSQTATLPTSNQTLPQYTTSAQQYQINESPTNGTGVTQISTAELQRRQEELERKTQELDRREAEFLRNSNTSTTRRNNWPPFPDQCCFQPCFFHDIEIDIPPEFQKIVQRLYYLWIFYAGVMCMNIIGGLLILFNTGSFTVFGLGLFYALLFTPVSFLCWYRPAYKAFHNDSSANFMLFFMVFSFQLVVMIIQTIGFPNGGSIGFMTALSQFETSIFTGIICIIIAISFGISAAANVIMLTRIHAIYRSSGASMDKGIAEFQTEFFRNQSVQAAARDATRVVVDSQMSRNRY